MSVGLSIALDRSQLSETLKLVMLGTSLPNPLMPPDVAYAHFRETLGFSIVLGGIAGWLLSKPPNPVGSVTAP